MKCNQMCASRQRFQRDINLDKRIYQLSFNTYTNYQPKRTPGHPHAAINQFCPNNVRPLPRFQFHHLSLFHSYSSRLLTNIGKWCFLSWMSVHLISWNGQPFQCQEWSRICLLRVFNTVCIRKRIFFFDVNLHTREIFKLGCRTWNFIFLNCVNC